MAQWSLRGEFVGLFDRKSFASVAALVVLVGAGPSVAQDNMVQAPETAQASRVATFDIPPQPLA